MRPHCPTKSSRHGGRLPDAIVRSLRLDGVRGGVASKEQGGNEERSASEANLFAPNDETTDGCGHGFDPICRLPPAGASAVQFADRTRCSMLMAAYRALGAIVLAQELEAMTCNEAPGASIVRIGSPIRRIRAS